MAVLPLNRVRRSRLTPVRELDEPPEAVKLRLVWSTRGKGESNLGVAETVRFENPTASESRRCTLQLPNAPYSFSGKLISLIWSIELEAEPSEESVQTEITIAPGGVEVVLHKQE